MGGLSNFRSQAESLTGLGHGIWLIPIDINTALPYPVFMQTVIETAGFLKDAKGVGLSDDEREEIVDFISENPLAGIGISGTGGAQKMRLSAKGKGKSGGVHVITFIQGLIFLFFFLTCLPKATR